MNTRSMTLLAAVATALLASSAAAQDTPDGYIPLFSPEQIENAASAEARQRMLETEERNRSAWIARQRRLEAEQPASSPGGGDAEASDSAPVSSARASSRRKIYRWVDANGRVNFGDRPPARAHNEVTLRGTAAPAGAPAAPGLPLGERD